MAAGRGRVIDDGGFARAAAEVSTWRRAARRRSIGAPADVRRCVSEGWARFPVGKSLDRHGNAMTMKAHGTVEVWFLDSPAA